MMLVDVINEYLKDNHKRWYAYRDFNLPDAIVIRHDGGVSASVVIDTTSQTIYAYLDSIVGEINYSDFDILDKLEMIIGV